MKIVNRQGRKPILKITKKQGKNMKCLKPPKNYQTMNFCQSGRTHYGKTISCSRVIRKLGHRSSIFHNKDDTTTLQEMLHLL